MNLIDALKRDEGLRLEVYEDSVGIRTAGYGHNLEAHGIDWPLGTPVPLDTANAWLLQDAANASAYVDSHLPWAKDLDTARHDVLVNMAFNLGAKILGFHRTLTFLEDQKWDAAAEAMLDSLWARQVGARATRLAEQIRTGISQ
jgi:lysozyme